MDSLQRASKRAEAEAERRRQGVEAAWAGTSGITIRREGDRLVMSGRGLVRQWLDNAKLRFSLWSIR